MTVLTGLSSHLAAQYPVAAALILLCSMRAVLTEHSAADHHRLSTVSLREQPCTLLDPGRAAARVGQSPHLFVLRISWLEMLHSFWDTKHRIKGPGKRDATH